MIVGRHSTPSNVSSSASSLSNELVRRQATPFRRPFCKAALITLGFTGHVLCLCKDSMSFHPHRTHRWSDWLPALGCWVGAWPLAELGLGLALALIVALLLLARNPGRPCRTAALLTLATLVSWQLPTVSETRIAVPAGLAVADVTVISTQVRSEGGNASTHALVRVERGQRLADQERVPSSARIWVRGFEFAPGTRARVLLDIRPWPTPQNVSQPLEWPPRAHGHARLVGDPSRVQTQDVAVWLHDARASLRAKLHRDLDTQTAAFVSALTLGDQGLIDPRDAERVRKSGAAHVLAVSGLHIGVVSFIALWFLRRVVLGLGSLLGWLHAFDLRRACHGLVIPLTLMHGLLAGGSPSALRASWMVAGAHFALMLGFRPCAKAALMVLPLLAATYDTSLLKRPAFALSYLACLVLAHARQDTPSASHGTLRRWIFRVRQATSLSTRITVATTPVVLSCFGQLAWIGALSNVLFVPFSSLVLVPFAYLQLLLSALGQGAYTAAVSSGLRDLLLVACTLAERAPTIETRALSTSEVLAIGLVCIAFFCGGRLRWVALLGFAIAATWTPLEAKLSSYVGAELEVRVLDVGQGDATLIRHGTQFAMVDMGRSVRFGDDAQPWTRNDAVSHSLRAQQVRTLELLVISHAHPDHYASWHAVANHIHVKELWLPAVDHPAESADFRDLLSRARAKGTRVRLAAELCGQVQDRIGLTFEVLAPCERPSALDSLNDASLVLRVVHGKRSILFAGDIERKAEEHLLTAGVDLHADIVKVPHHGSRTSSSHPFVAAVDPALAIISVGGANRFGHPHPDVVERWKTTACVLVTAQNGGVTLYSDAEHWSLREPEHASHCATKPHGPISISPWSR